MTAANITMPAVVITLRISTPLRRSDDRSCERSDGRSDGRSGDRSGEPSFDITSARRPETLRLSKEVVKDVKCLMWLDLTVFPRARLTSMMLGRTQPLGSGQRRMSAVTILVAL